MDNTVLRHTIHTYSLVGTYILHIWHPTCMWCGDTVGHAVLSTRVLVDVYSSRHHMAYYIQGIANIVPGVI